MSSPRAVRAQRTALLAIGDEVLRGEVSNTNAAFVAERLFEGGYESKIPKDLEEKAKPEDKPKATPPKQSESVAPSKSNIN